MLLALHLGCTLGELCDRMTGQEFGMWQSYYGRHPFGEQCADLRAGVIASTVANYAGRTRAEGVPPAVAADFMPRLRASAVPSKPVADEPGDIDGFIGAMKAS